MPPSLQQIRKDILSAADELFNREISIDERALQAIEVVSRRRKTANAGHVWAALSATLPAIGNLYDHLGVKAPGPHSKRPGWSYWPVRVRSAIEADKPASLRWFELLREIFSIVDRRDYSFQLTETGVAVSVSGRVSPMDLAKAIIESGWVSRLDGQRSINLILRGLAKDSLARRWDEAADQFSTRVSGVLRGIATADESCGDQQFVLFHDGAGYRVSPFGYFGTYKLQDSPLPDGSLWVARANVIQPLQRFSETSVSWFEGLINSSAPEREFQMFFESHPEFLLALGDYARIHPQLIMRGDDGSKLIPDFFLEKLNSNFADICDLKTADVAMVRHQKNRERFRDLVMEAVAQLETYRDWFEDRENRRTFAETYGLGAYRPKVVMIIGRRRAFSDEMERIRMETRLPPWVLLRTYDDVLDKARSWRQLATEVLKK